LKTIEEPDCRKECLYYEACQKYEGRVIFQPLMRDALVLLKEQEQAMKEKDGTISNLIVQIKEISQCYERVVRCKDCKNWIPGYITDQDDFIPPKCGKYQQMVGHSNDDFCSLAEKKEGR
jgi:hypothetical protein